MPKAPNPRDLLSEPESSFVNSVLEFLRRGQRAQAAVDRILAAEPDRKRLPRPKGHA